MKKLEILSSKNTTYKKIFFAAKLILLTAFILFTLTACSKKKGYEIPLDNSDPLALAPDVKWAVVKVPYASFRKETSWDAQTSAYCKQGEYFPILATSTVLVEGESEIWYRFEQGWLPDSTLSVYSNKLRAAKASTLLK